MCSLRLCSLGILKRLFLSWRKIQNVLRLRKIISIFCVCEKMLSGWEWWKVASLNGNKRVAILKLSQVLKIYDIILWAQPRYSKFLTWNEFKWLSCEVLETPICLLSDRERENTEIIFCRKGNFSSKFFLNETLRYYYFFIKIQGPCLVREMFYLLTE